MKRRLTSYLAGRPAFDRDNASVRKAGPVVTQSEETAEDDVSKATIGEGADETIEEIIKGCLDSAAADDPLNGFSSLDKESLSLVGKAIRFKLKYHGKVYDESRLPHYGSVAIEQMAVLPGFDEGDFRDHLDDHECHCEHDDGIICLKCTARDLVALPPGTLFETANPRQVVVRDHFETEYDLFLTEESALHAGFSLKVG